MKKFILISGFIFLSYISFGQVKVTTTGVNFRKAPKIENNTICVIPSGTYVTVVEDTVNYTDWTKVSYDNKIGFIYSSYLLDKDKFEANPPQSKVKYYTNSRGERVQSPTHYKSPPDGASAECMDGTYSFSRNRRGTCSHHGGVKRWL